MRGKRALRRAHQPDLVITDIRMPPSFTDEGLQAAVDLRRTRPGLAMVVLSQYVQHAYAADLLDSGDGRGVGYLLKDRVADVEENSGPESANWPVYRAVCEAPASGG